ncbi:hypothetical protein [Hyphomicrobium sp. MC1]|uniref:hypothetical protein n=1 Tax=Hyphomicrobium sp. (strain MC1) TaxID=717785 RepID=UPI0026BEDAB3
MPAFVNWPAKLEPRVVNEPLHMVDVMPTLLALAGGKGSNDHPFDGKVSVVECIETVCGVTERRASGHLV